MRLFNNHYFSLRPIDKADDLAKGLNCQNSSGCPNHSSQLNHSDQLGTSSQQVLGLPQSRTGGTRGTKGTKALPAPVLGRKYLLYVHVPFCKQLCPYCSFNRYPFQQGLAEVYFEDLRSEMRMLKDLGYDFRSLYVGGGTPTVLPLELVRTIDLAKELFSINEVSCETNPDDLTPEIVKLLQGRVQRLSVGVQSFDDQLLAQMQRFHSYGSGLQTLLRIQELADSFPTFNVDMIFNFPSQTEDMLIRDLAYVLESGCSQVTFYPLMAAPSVSSSLSATVGNVNYRREQYFYEIICEALIGGANPEFEFSDAWSFNRLASAPSGSVDQAVNMPPEQPQKLRRIDEYIVDYEEYPAIGSGGFSYLDGNLYVNTFSLRDYHNSINSGQMSVYGKTRFARRDQMRYRFMMQLFGLRLDKKRWLEDFGCSVAQGLTAEYFFFQMIGAIGYEDESEIRLSPKGRYLMVALMREFFIGVNKVRDKARSSLDPSEMSVLYG
ncbi:MAG: radical SAM protein [Coriobacteriales bacterium]|nr:radical SAM protein [Coriobacteriales bacterium]